MNDDRAALLEIRARLDELLAPVAAPSDAAPEFMTVDEYAARIKVAPATVRRMTRQDGLPHVRPRPRTIRIKVAEADQHLAAKASRSATTLGRIDAMKGKLQ
jgi:excisionase family DNA binding protein